MTVLDTAPNIYETFRWVFRVIEECNDAPTGWNVLVHGPGDNTHAYEHSFSVMITISV